MAGKPDTAGEMTPTAVVPRAPRFDAFLSYSHEADSGVAPLLKRGLAAFAKPWYRRAAAEVFLDTTNLSVEPQAFAKIREAVLDARWFVLLASPKAAASPWVKRELTPGWFRREHHATAVFVSRRSEQDDVQ